MRLNIRVAEAGWAMFVCAPPGWGREVTGTTIMG